MGGGLMTCPSQPMTRACAYILVSWSICVCIYASMPTFHVFIFTCCLHAYYVVNSCVHVCTFYVAQQNSRRTCLQAHACTSPCPTMQLCCSSVAAVLQNSRRTCLQAHACTSPCPTMQLVAVSVYKLGFFFPSDIYTHTHTHTHS